MKPAGSDGGPGENGGGVERWRRAASQVGLTLAVVLLVADVVAIARNSPARAWTVPASFGVLLALPFVNLAAAVVEEARRREWVYVAAAAVVVALLIYAIV